MIEPSDSAEETLCEDITLVDPTVAKYQSTSSNKSIDEVKKRVTKMNFAKKFKRAEFTGESLQPSSTQAGSNKNKKKGNHKSKFESRNINYIKKPTRNLLPGIKFTIKHRLDENSHPADWLRAFIPDTPPKGSPQEYSKKQWCQYTNMKAELDCAGKKNQDGLEYNFENFTPREIEQQLSMYLFQGLNPSPQLVMKAKPQSVEPIQGNDLISSKIGRNFERRHRQFRRYFACQHPYKPVPPISTHPNWKVDPFLRHLNKVCIQAASLPENLSMNESMLMHISKHSTYVYSYIHLT